MSSMSGSETNNNIIIRLLNSTLRGCEFNLTTGGTIFLITDDTELKCHHQGNILPENMIFIPAPGENFSFEIHIDEGPAPAIQLKDFSSEKQEERARTTNKIESVGCLKFALRYANECFSEEIRHFQLAEPVRSEPRVIQSKRPKVFRGLAVAALLGCFAMGALFYMTAEKRQISTLASLLNTQMGHYDIIPGKNGVMYVVASDARGMVWAQQTLAKSAVQSEVKVISRATASEEFLLWFAAKYPGLVLHRFSFSSIKQPLLELSKERTKLSTKAHEEIISASKNAFPWLDSLRISFASDALVSSVAEQGLRKIAVPYTRVNNKRSITFIVQGSLDDSEFERLRQFVDGYNTSWNGEYVQFAIEVKDDWLKGKSFKYGSRGYVKLSPGHWYFPKSL